MYFSSLIFPLTLALTAVAEPLEASKALPHGFEYARQFRREHKGLVARLDAEPEFVCGSGFDDCGNGWCCGKGRTCDGELQGIPLCKAPDVTVGPLGPGSDVVSPFKNVDEVLDSLTKKLAELTTGVPEVGDSGDETATTAGGATGTGQPANGQETGAAAVWNAPAGFGSTAMLVAGLWAAAAVGGASWMLM